MPVCKLYYFNSRGRAEPARLCFAASGVKYEDVRFTREEWQQQKEAGLSPFGYLPMLEVDGKKLNESMAIFRYVAKECGLVPSDCFEAAQCDMVIEITNDLFAKMVKFYFEKNEELKKQYTTEFLETHLPKFLTNAAKLLKANNGGQGFFIGDKLSSADVIMYYTMDFEAVKKQAADNHPELKAHYDRIANIPNIKKWLETRPVTEH